MPSVPPRTPLVPQARTARRHFVLKPNYNSLAPPRCGGSQPRRNGYVSPLCAAKLAKGILIDIITAQTFNGVRMQTLVDAAACAAGLHARIVEAVATALGQSLPAGQISIGVRFRGILDVQFIVLAGQ